MNIHVLQKKYPRFVYKNYSYKISRDNLEISFNFKIEPDIRFKPKITVKNIDKKRLKRLGERILSNLIFNLGLIEMISYWKAACSPKIEIKAGPLNKEQIRWWQDLIIKGMGQFFYENKIKFQKPSLTLLGKKPAIVGNLPKEKESVLVPVGGGKDSAVALESLSFFAKKEKIKCFSLNPTIAAQKIIKVGKCKKPVIMKRIIDKKLLELNRKGFLNGHTPFSAYLAFLSVLAATLSGSRYVAFANERSSNEGNLKYLKKIINHQWSKSFEFENKFRNYSKKYLAKNIDYFSFLRPLYEIQITKLFSKYPKYFPVFLSCNEAYKTASGTKKPTKKWCGNCPKCLSVFASLYSFIGEKKMIKIFGKNLFEDKKLLPTMQELIGERGFKPFECVGTKKESLIAFYLALRSSIRKRAKLPFLLKYFKEKVLPKYPNLERESKKILISWNNQHNLPKELRIIDKLKKSCYK